MPTMLFLIGLILFAGGYLTIALNAFKKSIVWGVACILLPPSGVIFAALNWKDNIKPLLTCISGFILKVLIAYFFLEPII